MSDVSDAFAAFQTALVTQIDAAGGDTFFAQDGSDTTTIKTTKNIKVIGSLTARDDVLGNENIS